MWNNDRDGVIRDTRYNSVLIRTVTRVLGLFGYLAVIAIVFPLHAEEIMVAEKIDIGKVWAGHPVNFAIKTVDKFQCIAYYDTTRRMVVAARTLESPEWSYTVLPTTTGWDSHNYIELAIDDSGYVHVSGNMHNASSLIYFRSQKPWSIESFVKPGMVGTQEGSVTYPIFIKGLKNQLIFQYRDGGSGSGNTIWNGYDISTKKWKRITSKGLFDGEGEVNAYQTTPEPGPDGFFHIIWMWRETPVANTNFHLSHIKSRDLATWQTMAGEKVTMPVTQSTPGVIVDPVKSGRGLINMDFWISWDTHDRAVVTYHRYDNNSISQIFNTRWEDNAWKIYQTSTWSGFKWNLDREGSLTHDIAATRLMAENGELVQNYVYRTNEVRRWMLDETTLKPKSDGVYEPPAAMDELYKVESSFPGMQVNQLHEGEYYLRWETMPINQDIARSAGTYPSSSTLRLYKFSYPTHVARERMVAVNHYFSLEKNRYRIVVNRSPDGASNSSAFLVALFSIDGKFIAEYTSGQSGCCVIPVGTLQRGVYIVHVVSGSAMENRSGAALIERVVIY